LLQTQGIADPSWRAQLGVFVKAEQSRLAGYLGDYLFKQADGPEH